jgi:hypothetical protein
MWVMGSQKEEIIICSGCIGKNYEQEYDLEDILVQVESALAEARPDKEWNLNSQTCFRFCPKGRITLSVAEKMTMTREATIESMVNEILSFYKK